MPYIKQAERESARLGMPKTCGQLNYKISVLLDNVITEQGLSYDTINGIIGVLTCIQLELYRRVAAPYEDKKLQENGEVFLSKP